MRRSDKKMIPAATRPILHEYEWKFDGVPKDQIEACYLYEYGREFFKSSKQLQKFQKDWDNRTKRQCGKGYEAWGKTLDLLQTRCKNFPYIDFNYFPQTTWQGLPVLPKTPQRNFQVDLRKRAAEDVNDWSERFRKSRFDRLYMATLRELEPLNTRPRSLPSLLAVPPCQETLSEIYAQAASTFGIWNCNRPPSEQTEYGLFLINWSHRDPEIKRAFNEWLQREREERQKLGITECRPQSSNRGGFRDRLNWLGALRVINHYRHKELVDYNDTNLKVSAPYSHYPDLRVAANKARQEIARLFPDDWSEAEWQRKQDEETKHHPQKMEKLRRLGFFPRSD